MMSRESLLKEARRQTYKPEILEKVYRLLAMLKQITQVPYLKNRLVLKGGTAMNLFHFEGVPRLSVDIDLNYIGQLNRSDMLEERPLVKDAIEKILIQNKFERYRSPNNHAGGKMVWRYPSVLGQNGNLEIDLNYMYRQPLWPIQWKSPNLGNENDFQFPVLDIHELTAGKLSALMARTASRDLYDAHYLLRKCTLDNKKLRFAFIVYISMTELDLSLLSPEFIRYNEIDIRNRLIPVLRQENVARTRLAIRAWTETLIGELREGMSQILPLHKCELDFISLLRNRGIIDASMITDDVALQTVVSHHPALQWAIKRTNKR